MIREISDRKQNEWKLVIKKYHAQAASNTNHWLPKLADCFIGLLCAG